MSFIPKALIHVHQYYFLSMELLKAQKMLLGLAIGDALGKEYENIPRIQIHINDPLKGYKGGTGIYTDDTQMSLAVAELMSSNLPFNEETLASSLVYAYRRDKRSGYSSFTKTMLETSWCGMDFLKSVSGQDKLNRKSDGSSMRAVPVGLFPDTNEVIRHAQINSEITHSHPKAILASIGVALASHYSYYTYGDPSEIIRYVIKNLPPIDHNYSSYLSSIDTLSNPDYQIILGKYSDYGPPYNDAKYVLGMVLFILKQFSQNPEAAIVHSLRFGGDVDTTLSIILGIVMMNNTVDQIPQLLIDDLENGGYGKDHLMSIGKALDEKYPVM